MRHLLRCCLIALTLLPGARAAATQAREQLSIDLKSFVATGDLDGMIARAQSGCLRSTARPSISSIVARSGGLLTMRCKLFEETLNKQLKTRHLRVAVAFVPVSRDELLPALIEGRGDIAAANLTITPEREALVDFTQPLVTGVNEIVVTGPASPAIASLDDLAGKDVFVRGVPAPTTRALSRSMRASGRRARPRSRSRRRPKRSRTRICWR